MLVGVGTDILSVQRMQTILDSENAHAFIQKVYTGHEQAICKERQNPLMYYASRFAAKEAIFKAMGIEDISFNQIDIQKDNFGKPTVTLYKQAAALASQRHIERIELSLSSDDDYVVAFAVAVAIEGALEI